MTGRLTALVFATCLLLVAFPLLAQDAQAVTVKTTISMDQSQQTASVAPGEMGLVSFTGFVTCNETGLGSTVQSVVVSLTASAGGWATTITPSTMTFNVTSQQQPFCVSVMIPEGTSSSLTQELIVGGTAQVAPGVTSYTLDEAQVMIKVKQYYKLEVNCTEGLKECAPGDSVDFKLELKNEGNGQDTIRLEVEDGAEELDSEGIILQLSQTEFIIDEGGQVIVTAIMSVPSTFNGNEVFTVKLKFYSFQALSLGEIPVEIHYPIYLRANSYVNVSDDDDDAEEDDDTNTTTEEEETEKAPGFEAGFAIISLLLSVLMLFTVGARRRVRRT